MFNEKVSLTWMGNWGPIYSPKRNITLISNSTVWGPKWRHKYMAWPLLYLLDGRYLKYNNSEPYYYSTTYLMMMIDNREEDRKCEETTEAREI